MDEQAQGVLILGRTRQMTKIVSIIAPTEFCNGLGYFQSKKKEFSDDQCPNSVYFDFPLFIM